MTGRHDRGGAFLEKAGPLSTESVDVDLEGVLEHGSLFDG